MSPCPCTRSTPCPAATALRDRAGRLSCAADGLEQVTEAYAEFVAHRTAAGFGRRERTLTEAQRAQRRAARGKR